MLKCVFNEHQQAFSRDVEVLWCKEEELAMRRVHTCKKRRELFYAADEVPSFFTPEIFRLFPSEELYFY